MWYLNDGRNLPGDTTPETERLSSTKESSVQSLQTKPSQSAAEFSRFRSLAVKALRNPRAGKEISVHYGDSYDLNV